MASERIGPTSVEQEQVRQALRKWHQKDATASPLAAHSLYHLTLRAENDSRRATNRILLQGLEEMEKCHPREAMLLRRSYLDNIKNHQLASEHNISDAQLYRTLGIAITHLTDALIELDVQTATARRARLTERLEPSTYTNLVGVDDHLHNLGTILVQQGPPWLVAIEGIGGIGKTTLADALIRNLIDHGSVAEIAWVTARTETLDFSQGIAPVDRPALSAESLIGTLASQLVPDIPLSPERARNILEDWLKEQPHIVVIDNLETLADVRGLLSTLRSLADPTKFLLTSRESLYAEPDVYAFPIPELDTPNAIAFIRQEAEQRNLASLSQASDEELQAILAIVGGNPLAIRLVIGQTHIHSLDTVLDNLKLAQGRKIEELYTYIYREAWEQLEELPRQALLAMPLVTRYGATLDQLAVISDIETSALIDVLETLVRLNLINRSGDLHERRYTIHSLTRTFLHEQVLQWH